MKLLLKYITLLLVLVVVGCTDKKPTADLLLQVKYKKYELKPYCLGNILLYHNTTLVTKIDLADGSAASLISGLPYGRYTVCYPTVYKPINKKEVVIDKEHVTTTLLLDDYKKTIYKKLLVDKLQDGDVLHIKQLDTRFSASVNRRLNITKNANGYSVLFGDTVKTLTNKQLQDLKEFEIELYNAVGVNNSRIRYELSINNGPVLVAEYASEYWPGVEYLPHLVNK